MNPIRPLVPALALGLLILAACGDRSEGSASAEASPAPDAADVAPAPAVEAAPPPPAPAGDDPAEVRNDPAVIHFQGFGPAAFGSNEEAVRQAWGRPLTADTPSDGSTCYFVRMDPGPGNGFGIAFMFEGGKFVRYDVDSPAHAAPGDLAVGMRGEEVLARFPGRVEEQPDKYEENGRNLVVSPGDGGEGRLVFDVDGSGTITGWRLGVPPQVHYSEGCS